MSIKLKLGKFADEVARALRNFHYWIADDGSVVFPRAGMRIGGGFRNALAPAGAGFGPWEYTHNRVVNQGLDYILNVGLGNGTQVATFYLAPFSGNVSPTASWTGANFTANATEFTAYTASNRLPWTVVPSTARSIGNTAGLADSTMTLSAGGPYNIYGVGLLQAQAKSSTTGILFAATRFDNPRLNMSPGDRLALEYICEAKDEADV